MIVTDAAGCRDSITLNNLIITTDPVPGFYSNDIRTCPNGNVYFFSTSTPAGLTYSWDFGDGGTSALAAPLHNYTATGLYDVKLRVLDSNGCLIRFVRTSYIYW